MFHPFSTHFFLGSVASWAHDLPVTGWDLQLRVVVEGSGILGRRSASPGHHLATPVLPGWRNRWCGEDGAIQMDPNGLYRCAISQSASLYHFIKLYYISDSFHYLGK